MCVNIDLIFYIRSWLKYESACSMSARSQFLSLEYYSLTIYIIFVHYIYIYIYIMTYICIHIYIYLERYIQHKYISYDTNMWGMFLIQKTHNIQVCVYLYIYICISLYSYIYTLRCTSNTISISKCVLGANASFTHQETNAQTDEAQLLKTYPLFGDPQTMVLESCFLIYYRYTMDIL